MTTDDHTGFIRTSIRTTIALAVSTFAWVATVALAQFGPEIWGEELQAASWAAVGLNLLAGAAWIVVFTRYIRGLDDLERKLMLDALGVALGVGWVVGFAYVVANSAGLLELESAVGLVAALVGIVFLVAYFAGKVRYR
jgi:hypothetical protein